MVDSMWCMSQNKILEKQFRVAFTVILYSLCAWIRGVVARSGAKKYHPRNHSFSIRMRFLDLLYSFWVFSIKGISIVAMNYKQTTPPNMTGCTTKCRNCRVSLTFCNFFALPAAMEIPYQQWQCLDTSLWSWVNSPFWVTTSHFCGVATAEGKATHPCPPYNSQLPVRCSCLYIRIEQTLLLTPTKQTK